MTNVAAHIARARLDSLLKQVAKKRRFIITRGGKPAAVLLSISDFDDMLEELDPEFQKSLRSAADETRAGQGVTLPQYLKERRAAIAEDEGWIEQQPASAEQQRGGRFGDLFNRRTRP